jgi:carbohydrate-binding DOMON domain-containing protein
MKTKVTLLLLTALMMGAATAHAGDLTFKDPEGDDKGHGKITYPTDKVYKKGSFDLVEMEIEDKGSDIEITVEFAARIEDPWNSKSWNGHGFSLQFVQVYVDKDHKAGSGHDKALPGLNVAFQDASRWEKVLLISPQPTNRLNSEVQSKAKAVGKDVVTPSRVRVQGKKIKATFKKADIGGFDAKWGFQALVQSNEGYPTKEDMLTRKVNEYEGEHRFGGGHDYDCDAHVIDMLAGAAKGDKAEAQAQFKELSGYTCDASGKGDLAKVGMIYQ